jgi:predicted AlkP superfamily phosphohydrolase/phosphomutase
LPRFFHPRQLITGAAAPRPLTAEDVANDPAFWKEASRAGRRVAIADIPHVPLARGLNGVQVLEYGLHDRHFGTASHPGHLLDRLQAAHGTYPVASCDHYGGSHASNLRLLHDLLIGIERKTAVLLDLLAQEPWDLFACAFTEPHCAGHWLWHYHDPSHWGYAGAAPTALREGIRKVYARVDAALGRLIAAAGSKTTMVLASHGMAPYVAGYQLLPEVLARLGLSSGGTGASRLRDLQHTAKHWVPRRYWERLGRLVVEHPIARAALGPFQRGRGALFFPLESAETRAVYVPNNTIGAIRLNVRGREPHGSVDPDRGAETLLREMGHELLALRQPATGTPIVSHVITALEAFGPAHHPDVPDLMVGFRQDLGPLETCESPRVGRVHVPVGSRWGRRSGDHSPRSAVWIAGEGFTAGETLAGATLLDVAPTILEALDCPLPPWLDGAPLSARRA